MEARGSGQAQITMETSHNKQLTIELDNVLFVPKLACNLISVRAVTQKGLIVQFGHTCCWINDSDGKALGKGRLVKRMYVLSCDTNTTAAYHQLKGWKIATLARWHQRLGHINRKQLRRRNHKKSISRNQKGYRPFYMQSKKVVIRRDVNFNENDFGSQKQYLKMGPEPAKEDKRQTKPEERDTDAEEYHP